MPVKVQETTITLRSLELGAIQAHLLYHASKEQIYGAQMLDELQRHGFNISYGTLYPTLHRMMKDGLLHQNNVRNGSVVRKLYMITPQGETVLAKVKHIIIELFEEVIEEKDE